MIQTNENRPRPTGAIVGTMTAPLTPNGGGGGTPLGPAWCVARAESGGACRA